MGSQGVCGDAGKPHPPDDFNPIIGDCLHNLRSALDSLVYALVIAEKGNPLPEDIAKRVQFPIADNPKAFKGAKRRITDIPSGAQVEIEGLQPYNRRQDDPTRDPLWILNELSNIDKHRLPHLTLFALGAMHLGGNARFKIGQPWERAAVEDCAKLLGFSARRDEPSRKVHVEFKLELSIAFEGPIAQGADVFEILPAIRDDIMDEILPPQIYFGSEDTRIWAAGYAPVRSSLGENTEDETCSTT